MPLKNTSHQRKYFIFSLRILIHLLPFIAIFFAKSTGLILASFLGTLIPYIKTKKLQGELRSKKTEGKIKNLVFWKSLTFLK